MRVTKLRRGYRINLSDTEMNVLEYLVQLGVADLADEDLGKHPAIHPAARHHLRGGRFSRHSPLEVDGDRRGG